MSLWGSGVYPSFHPVNYVQKHLKLCVRCPPRIQQVLKHVEEDFSERPNYTYQCTSLPDDRFSLPTDGPDEELLDHSGHVNEAKDIKDCRSCGQLLADYIDRLRSQNSSLRFEDIVISGTFDICGISCELLQALVERDIPLQFADDSLESPPPYPGKVFVTGSSALQGLEAKIVVFVPDVSRIPQDSGDHKQFRHNLPLWLRDLARWNRLNLWFVASRNDDDDDDDVMMMMTMMMMMTTTTTTTTTTTMMMMIIPLS
nr:hypothetical protein BaRGS_000574 [Batillaria attramentaria]